VFATLALRAFHRFRDSVAVNADGVWYLPRKGEPTFIAWVDVANVKVDDPMQRLVLFDSTGSRRIRLEYQLENFGQLRDFVVAHTASDRLWSPAVNVFHCPWISKGVYLACAVLILILAWPNIHAGRVVPSCIPVGLAAMFLSGLTQDPTRIVIAADAIVIEYLGWRRTIPFNVIAGIDLADIRNRGNVWATVIIKRQRGRPIKVWRVREGSVSLHEALQSAWRAAIGSEKAGQLS
jgi:hypothetical protein